MSCKRMSSGRLGSGNCVNVFRIAWRPAVVSMLVYKLSTSMVKRWVWWGTAMGRILLM